MPRIQALDPGIVNKIAAGEVIERPASVVKELLENSLDAGARRIDITIGEGGLGLIRVVDDGCGMEAEDLPLAVCSHATSKLHSADDLFHVSTLGFRGEALASVAEISHLTIRSRVSDSPSGAELSVVGGAVQTVVPAAAAPGTAIEVRNLFFNTPVRRKFLRTPATELGHITESLTRVALAFPHVHFTLTHDARTLFDLPPTSDWQGRIRELLGEEIAAALIPVERSEDEIGIHGFVADPSVSRGNNRMQYFFLNRRYIRDRALGHALSEAYRGLLMVGRMPVAFLHLDMAPDLVDVNVHPTKLEVRFVDSGRVYSLLLGMLRSHFLSHDLTAKGHVADALTGMSRAEPPHEAASPPFSLRPPAQASLWGPAGAANPPSDAVAPGVHLAPYAGTWARLPEFPITRTTDTDRTQEVSTPPRSTLATTPEGSPAMQVCHRYLVTESEQGLVVIDQHALHERILYEELRVKVMEGTLEQQRLLVPEPVELSPSEAGLLLEHQATIQELGIQIEPFSGNTLLVLSYPAMLANLGPADMLRKLAQQLSDSARAPDRAVLLDELLHMIACKAAVKAGDRLTAHEISALLERRHLVDDAHHCPHGRPTTLIFSREQLDRQFQRT